MRIPSYITNDDRCVMCGAAVPEAYSIKKTVFMSIFFHLHITFNLISPNIPAGRISTGKELHIASGGGIDYAVFLHRLNISRTSRSAPLTSPVSTSILKPNCPKYCHAIVTAGSVVSTDGASLERKAE